MIIVNMGYIVASFICRYRSLEPSVPLAGRLVFDQFVVFQYLGFRMHKRGSPVQLVHVSEKVG
jgi:hypothetical protein